MGTTVVVRPVSSDFETLNLQDVQQIMPDLPDAEANRPFIDGDHFQKGDGWVGPGPRSDNEQYGEFLNMLEPSFVSSNVMDECADRLRDAVLGREPRTAWVPRRVDLDANPLTDQEIAELAQLDEEVSWWWDRQDAHRLLKRLLKFCEWASQACWRLYVPSGLTDDNGKLPAITDLRTSLSKIFLDIPDPEESTVYDHPDTRQKLGIVQYTDSRQQSAAEVTFLNQAGTGTVVKLLPSNQEATNDFGGHLPIGMISLERAVFQESNRSVQRSLNMTLTLLQKGLVDNAFLEKFFKNALPPGKWVYQDDGQGNKVRSHYEVVPRGRGGSTDTWLQGIDYVDEQGRTVLSQPDVVFRDSIDPTGTIKASDYWYQKFLQDMKQEHILSNQATTPSGTSREQTRDDFIKSTRDPQNQTESAGAEMLITLVSMAEAFMGAPGKWTKKYKPIFVCRPDYGPLGVAERVQNVAEAEKGFMSDETAMSLNGIDDVVAELARIQKQKRAQLAISLQQATVVDLWSTIFPREVALKLAQFTDEEIAEIMDAITKAIQDDPGTDPTQQPPVVPGAPGQKPGVPGQPPVAKPGQKPPVVKPGQKPGA